MSNFPEGLSQAPDNSTLVNQTLRFAWWNTGLAKKKGGGRRQTTASDTVAVHLARDVIHLLSVEQVDIVVLGEMNHDIAEYLKGETNYSQLAAPDLPIELGIAVLFNSGRCRISFDDVLVVSTRRKARARGARFSVVSTDSPTGMWLIALHWPSRRLAGAYKTRLALGSGLQEIISNMLAQTGNETAYGIVCGDFNDEPFDDSLTAGLFGTRDRQLAREQSFSLYNPFWRLLGERMPHEGLVTQCGAGTYFWRGGEDSRWYTFDQFLFTSPFLADGHWRLVESETGIWDKPPLLAETGIVQPFDHYPIVAAIVSKPENQEI